MFKVNIQELLGVYCRAGGVSNETIMFQDGKKFSCRHRSCVMTIGLSTRWWSQVHFIYYHVHVCQFYATVLALPRDELDNSHLWSKTVLYN